MKFNWQCPFCNHHATVYEDDDYHTGGTVSTFRHVFNENKHGGQTISGMVIICPNDECNEYTITVGLFDRVYVEGKGWRDVEPPKRKWRLIPESKAKVFPSYIPKPILDDYLEACLICDLSPRASATLSRRCLQGIIRDFWGISRPRLIDEIAAIQEKIDSITWEAIDSVRSIGNIGAHMEKDINLIVDVEPDEASLLIELIETLLSDWYIDRHDKLNRMQKIKNVADQKKAEKKPT